MGIEYRAVIIVGLPYDEVKKHVPEIDEMLGGENVEAVSPYFDAPYRHCIIGFTALQSCDYGAIEIDLIGLAARQDKALAEWFAVFPNLSSKTYLMPYGW